MTESHPPRRTPTWLALLCALLLLAVPIAAHDDDEEEDITTQILLSTVAGADLATIAARHGVTIIEGLPELGFWKVQIPPGSDLSTIVEQMNGDPDLAEVEPHREVDIPEGVQRSIPILGIASLDDFRSQPALTTIRYEPAASRHTGHGVTVAVLDTGINFDHPQVAGLTVLEGRDFIDQDLDPSPTGNGLDDDLDGATDEALHHGTYVAGLLRLTAPDIRLLPIRVLDAEGSGTAFGLARGIVHAVLAGAKVINISVAMADDSFIVERALDLAEERGVVLVAAAGNSGTADVAFPAKESEVIAVAAVDDLLRRAPFSSYGSDVDLSAPGVDLLSTFGSSDFAGWEGTSFATPLVTAGAALLLERYPGLDVDEIRLLLESTARTDFPEPTDVGLLGAGVVDLDGLTTALTDDRTSLRALDATTFRFSPVIGATSYDVARGDLHELRSGSEPQLGDLACLAEDVAATSFADATAPPPGQGFFYVFRPDGAGYDLADAVVRTAGAGDCATD